MVQWSVFEHGPVESEHFIALVYPSLPFHLPFSLPYSNLPWFLVPFSPICLSRKPLPYLHLPFLPPLFVFNVSPFCNPPLNFTPTISIPDFSSWNYPPCFFLPKENNFFSPWNFTPAISVPDISLLHFLSRHFIPRNLFLIYDDFTFNPQPPTFYQRENCPMFFLHEALVLSAFPTYFYKSAAQ